MRTLNWTGLFTACATGLGALLFTGCMAGTDSTAGVDDESEATPDTDVGTAEQAVSLGAHRITVKNSHLCFDVYGGSNADGAELDQWSCHGGRNQQFQLLSAGGGDYVIVALNSGKCLDVTGASMSPGAKVIQYTCHFGPNQRFRINDLTDGYSRIRAKHSGLCLDVTGGGTNPGARIEQWYCHGGANQRFRFE